MIQPSERFSPPELKEMLTVAEKAAQGVGDILAANLGAKDLGKSIAGSYSSLTYWDTWAQAQIVKELEAVDANIGISAEEGLHSATEDVYWVVDPIDGTYWYALGDGKKCHTSIALVEQVTCDACDTPHPVTVPVASTMFNFSSGKFYSAINDGRQSSPPLQTLEPGLGARLEYYGDDTENETVAIQNLERKIGNALLSNLACSYSMISIAQGQQDMLIIDDNPFTGEHDLAPGALYVVANGGEARSNGERCFTTKTLTSPHKLGSHILASPGM